MKSDTQMGALKYRAPERILRHVCTDKSDVWSLGCVFFEMLTNQKAFPDIASDNGIDSNRLNLISNYKLRRIV